MEQLMYFVTAFDIVCLIVIAISLALNKNNKMGWIVALTWCLIAVLKDLIIISTP